MPKKKRLIIWSFDPGQKNFAFASMSKMGIIRHYGLLRHTVTIINDPLVFNRQKKAFLEEIKELMSSDISNDDYECVIVLERFMTRGGFFRNNVSECVLIMIGLLIGTLPDNVTVNMITAAQWKKLFKSRKLSLVNKHIKEHIRDAMSIGLYHLLINNIISNETATKIKTRIGNYIHVKK